MTTTQTQAVTPAPTGVLTCEPCGRTFAPKTYDIRGWGQAKRNLATHQRHCAKLEAKTGLESLLTTTPDALTSEGCATCCSFDTEHDAPEGCSYLPVQDTTLPTTEEPPMTTTTAPLATDADRYGFAHGDLDAAEVDREFALITADPGLLEILRAEDELAIATPAPLVKLTDDGDVLLGFMDERNVVTAYKRRKVTGHGVNIWEIAVAGWSLRLHATNKPAAKAEVRRLLQLLAS